MPLPSAQQGKFRGLAGPSCVSWCAFLWLLWGSWATIGWGAGLAELDLQVIDAKTQEPLAVRIRITNSIGRAPRIRGVPRLGNDFTFRELLNFELKRGKYQFVIERGPHYRTRAGFLEADSDGFDQKILTLPRIANLREEGWYGGDLLVRRKREELDLLCEAEELDVVGTSTWTAGEAFTEFQAAQVHTATQLPHCWVDYSAGLRDGADGRLLAANLDRVTPEGIPNDSLGFAAAVRQVPGGHLCVLDAYAWDLPLLVAHDFVDSIALFSEKQRREEDQAEFVGRPVTEARFQGPMGLARYQEHIYFQLLNCGLRIAPAAWSGSGANKNPVGFNRVYVHSPAPPSSTEWFAGLREGRSVVSNGPLLRARANGELPGHVFRVATGETFELEVTCSLATRQKIDYLELVRDGRVVTSVRLDEWAKNRGKLPLVNFTESGWLVVRAASTATPTYRAAITAPFYVEVGEQPRVSAAAAQFFVDWVYDRARGLNRSKLPREQRRTRVREQIVARDYFQRLVAEATAP